MSSGATKNPAARRSRPDAFHGVDRRQAILETAARVICDRGYEGASIQEIADACELTKAGLYHHIGSKENLLAEIMGYGMDLFEAQVLSPVRDIDDPVLRLRACMDRNIKLVTRGSSKHITIILHEHATLKGTAGKAIDARKKKYVRFLEQSFAEAVMKGLIRPVSPKVAAFSFLGMVLWIYKWFRPDGELSEEQIAEAMIDLLFTGLEPARSPRAAVERP
jgi:AcrR family transcriptional regulator